MAPAGRPQRRSRDDVLGAPVRRSRFLIVIATTLCLSSQSAGAWSTKDLHLPAFFGSRSGVTKPAATATLDGSEAGEEGGGDVPKAPKPKKKPGTFGSGGSGGGLATLDGRPGKSAKSPMCGSRVAMWSPFSGRNRLAPSGRYREAPSRPADPAASKIRRRRLLVSMRGVPDGISRVAGGWYPDRRAGSPFQRRCDLEKKVKKTFEGEGEKMLAACLKAGVSCRHPEKIIRETARSLDGVRIWLSKRPKCMVVNKGTCPSSAGNLETGRSILGRRWLETAKPMWGSLKFVPRSKDLKFYQHASCALVGNGPSLQKTAKGDAIDAHDAVWRFNFIDGKDPTKMGRRFSRFSGKRTTYRVFSRHPSWKVMSGEVKIRPSSGEKWMFWHAHSMIMMPGIANKKIQKYEDLLMYSPPAINWMMAGYWQLRKDLTRLGLGPFSCPNNINSGLHALLLSLKLCERTSTFGISHLESLVFQGHMGDRGHKMTPQHSWGFDTMVLRVLRYAGRLDICNG